MAISNPNACPVGGVCPETLSGHSCGVCFPFSMASPITNPQPLQQGEARTLTQANLSIKDPLFYFPQKMPCFERQCLPRKLHQVITDTFFVVTFLYFLKINQRSCLPIQRFGQGGDLMLLYKGMRPMECLAFVYILKYTQHNFYHCGDFKWLHIVCNHHHCFQNVLKHP